MLVFSLVSAAIVVVVAVAYVARGEFEQRPGGRGATPQAPLRARMTRRATR